MNCWRCWPLPSPPYRIAPHDRPAPPMADAPHLPLSTESQLLGNGTHGSGPARSPSTGIRTRPTPDRLESLTGAPEMRDKGRRKPVVVLPRTTRSGPTQIRGRLRGERWGACLVGIGRAQHLRFFSRSLRLPSRFPCRPKSPRSRASRAFVLLIPGPPPASPRTLRQRECALARPSAIDALSRAGTRRQQALRGTVDRCWTCEQYRASIAACPFRTSPKM